MQNTKLKKVLLNGVIGSLIQIVLYVLLLLAAIEVLNYFGKTGNRNVGWGLAILYSVILFTTLVVIVNTLCLLVDKNWFTLLALALAACYYMFEWISDKGGINNWGLLFITIGLPCLFLKLLLNKVFRKRSTRAQ